MKRKIDRRNEIHLINAFCTEMGRKRHEQRRGSSAAKHIIGTHAIESLVQTSYFLDQFGIFFEV
jgi:hypothetical protein